MATTRRWRSSSSSTAMSTPRGWIPVRLWLVTRKQARRKVLVSLMQYKGRLGRVALLRGGVERMNRSTLIAAASVLVLGLGVYALSPSAAPARAPTPPVVNSHLATDRPSAVP